jgi:cytochrome c oxidase accessory protein FixG
MTVAAPGTLDGEGKRLWRYPQEVKGTHQRLRRLAAGTLLVPFFVAPWITIDGNPLVRLGLLSGRFFLLGRAIHVSEFFHFVFLFVLLGLTLFLATTLRGRIWCGYACPQTVFVDLLFRGIDRFVEGDALTRRRRDRERGGATWTGRAGFVSRKIAKHSIFASVAFAFAFHVVAYFADPTTLLEGWRGAATVVLIVFTTLAYVDGAILREQFCSWLCPYARFQSVLVDASTKQLGYDAGRGDPRGRSAAGDCIDCGLCVRVCPTGIDIRDGVNQLECVSCARCLDACDGVMANLGRPRGLIRYDTEESLSGPVSRQRPRRAMLARVRPRVVVYVLAIVGVAGVGVWLFLNRAPFHVMVVRVPREGFALHDGRALDLLQVKIANQAAASERYAIEVVPGVLASVRLDASPVSAPLAPGDEAGVPVLLSVDAAEAAHLAKTGVAPEATLRVRALGTGATHVVSIRLVVPQGGRESLLAPTP